MSPFLDLLLDRAVVHTMDPAHPRATRIGVWNGLVVGVDEQLEGFRAARTIDLDGATVVPGFHDAHCHTTSVGVYATQLELGDCATVADVLRRVAEHARSLPSGAWVIGAGYADRVEIGRHPTSSELDRAAAGRPVWLTHRSGHMCAVSSAVLALLPDPLPPDAVGYVQRDATGTPTGLLEEAAMELVKAVVGPGSVTDMVSAIDAATQQYAAEGVTSLTEAGIGCPGVDHSPLEVAAWQQATYEGRSRCRAHLMVYSELLHDVAHHPTDQARFGLDLGLRTGLGDPTLSISAMKIWLDGAGSTGDAASASDHDPDAHLVDDPRRLRRIIVDAHRAGWQVAAHAMGDRAVDVLLDAIEEAGPTEEVRLRRHRIEHGGLIRPDQVQRLARLGVVVVIQPVFIREFGDVLAQHFGADKVSWSIRHRSLLDAGVVVAASSDRPVAPGAPLVGAQAMVERLTESGSVYSRSERVAVTEALRAYTRHPAYAVGREHQVGTIAARHLADLVVLDADPAAVSTSEISRIKVLATLVGGAPTHDPDSLVTTEPVGRT